MAEVGMRRLGLWIAVLCALPAAALGCDRPGNLGELRAAVIAGVNDARAGAGLAALRENDRLTQAAQGHACDIAARGSVSHTGSDGSDLTGRLRGAGYRFSAAAENTGRGFGSPERAVDWWMNSSGHRANILMEVCATSASASRWATASRIG
jgi:uncharacterized protein YkwD